MRADAEFKSPAYHLPFSWPSLDGYLMRPANTHAHSCLAGWSSLTWHMHLKFTHPSCFVMLMRRATQVAVMVRPMLDHELTPKRDGSMPQDIIVVMPPAMVRAGA